MSPGEEGAVLEGDLLRERERLAVERLEQILLADHLQLLAVPVVGERLDDVGSGSRELDVELAHDVGVLEHDLGDEAAGLEIPSPLELEQVALGADDRAVLKPLEQPGPPAVLLLFSVLRHGRYCAARAAMVQRPSHERRRLPPRIERTGGFPAQG